LSAGGGGIVGSPFIDGRRVGGRGDGVAMSSWRGTWAAKVRWDNRCVVAVPFFGAARACAFRDIYGRGEATVKQAGGACGSMLQPYCIACSPPGAGAALPGATNLFCAACVCSSPVMEERASTIYCGFIPANLRRFL